MYWKSVQIVVIMLFFCQAILGFVVWLGIPVPMGPVGVTLGILGLFGLVAVILLNDVEDQRDRVLDREERLKRDRETLIPFVFSTVQAADVARTFRELKIIFRLASQELVTFYQKREAALARILKQHPEDEEMQAYHAKKYDMEEEERNLKRDVQNAKDRFWDYHKDVRGMNTLIRGGRTNRDMKFECPDSIKMDEAEVQSIMHPEKSVGMLKSLRAG